MSFKGLKIIFISIIIFSCTEKKDKLFFIKNYEDLVFMAESTNVKKLKSESKLLHKDEESINVDDFYTFKHFGKIFENNIFEVHIIFSKKEEPDLYYSFQIRTINKNSNQIIESFNLSSYSHDSGIFCYGSINKELIIFRKCDYDGDGTDTKMKINSKGKFKVLN